MPTARKAEMTFSLSWESSTASHKDTTYISKVDFWRDVFPEKMHEDLASCKNGCRFNYTYQKGRLVADYSERNIVHVSNKQLPENNTSLLLGRFYPSSLVHRQLDRFPGDMRPFRVIQVSAEKCCLDTNHPLSGKELTVQAEITRLYPPAAQRGGQLNDISEVICGNGPGMQAPLPDSRKISYGDYPFNRKSKMSEEEFYSTPRLISHLDEAAARHVETFYSSFLNTDMRLLDLMSGFKTHLPNNFRNTDIVGLGLNAQEMAENDLLNDYVIHNLNTAPELPFSDSSFDGVICTSSIEYLTHPFEIIREISRILRPGGKVGIVISDRWFAGEEISFWSDLHPFERQGFVLNLLRSRHEFEQLFTESIRGVPRPVKDVHRSVRLESDPIFAVWATKKGS